MFHVQIQTLRFYPKKHRCIVARDSSSSCPYRRRILEEPMGTQITFPHSKRLTLRVRGFQILPPRNYTGSPSCSANSHGSPRLPSRGHRSHYKRSGRATGSATTTSARHHLSKHCSVPPSFLVLTLGRAAGSFFLACKSQNYVLPVLAFRRCSAL
jgi:hypothetical protein